jgi:hypothetical protein
MSDSTDATNVPLACESLAHAVKAFCVAHQALKRQMELCETAHIVLASGWNIRLAEIDEMPKQRIAHLCRH